LYSFDTSVSTVLVILYIIPWVALRTLVVFTVTVLLLAPKFLKYPDSFSYINYNLHYFPSILIYVPKFYFFYL